MCKNCIYAVDLSLDEHGVVQESQRCYCPLQTRSSSFVCTDKGTGRHSDKRHMHPNTAVILPIVCNLKTARNNRRVKENCEFVKVHLKHAISQKQYKLVMRSQTFITFFYITYYKCDVFSPDSTSIISVGRYLWCLLLFTKRLGNL